MNERNVNHPSENELSAYDDGELPLKKAKQVQDHLGICQACQRKFASLKRASAILRSAAERGEDRGHCLKVEEYAAFVTGALSKERTEEVERHLCECDACLQEMSIAHNLVSAEGRDIPEVRPELRERLKARVIRAVRGELNGSGSVLQKRSTFPQIPSAGEAVKGDLEMGDDVRVDPPTRERNVARRRRARSHTGKRYPWYAHMRYGFLPLAAAAGVLLVFHFMNVKTVPKARKEVSKVKVLAKVREEVCAEVIEIRGAAEIVTMGGSSSGRKGEKVKPGESVCTSSGGYVKLRYPDGSTLALGPNTEISLKEHESAKRIGMGKGKITADIARQPARAPIVITTPQADVEVLGTVLKLSIDEDSTRLDVEEGLVKLTKLEDGKSVEVAVGQYAVAAAGIDLAVGSSGGALAAPLEKPAAAFFDDFEDAVEVGQNWEFTAGRWGRKEGPGRLCLIDNKAFALAGDPEWQDYTLEVRLRPLKGGRAGVIVRIQDPISSLDDIHNKNKRSNRPRPCGWLIGITDDGCRGRSEICGAIEDHYEGETLILNQWNTIRVAVQGGQIEFYLNGVLQKTVVCGRKLLSSGKIGLVVSNGHTHFDSVKVTGAM